MSEHSTAAFTLAWTTASPRSGTALSAPPNRPDRDKSPDDTVDIDDPVVVQIARRVGVYPAVICVTWAVQRGQTPIPFSTHRRNHLGNLKCGRGTMLSGEDMQALARIDRNNRLIKWHVFLWRDGVDWEALWDVNGEIIK